MIQALLLLAWLAQESNESLVNPFTSDADVAKGAVTFKNQCASCHGADARGGAQGPDLSSGQFRKATSDESLFQIINRGIPGTNMPAFLLNPGPAWQVVAYIRSLSLNKRTHIDGDATKGARLYAELGCARCHNGTAPDLAGIGQRRTVAELTQSIVDPQAEVASSAWRVRARLRNGQQVAGQRLNEDTFTIQVRQGESLKSIQKSDLADIQIDRRSPMPSFKDRLPGNALNDLLAYLIGGRP